MFGKIRAYTRIVRAILLLLYLDIKILIAIRINGRNEERGFNYRRRYILATMRYFGLEIEYQGNPSDICALYVSNHRSMIDPVILLRDIHAYVVAKAEIEKYPLIGRGAKETGVIYVKREAKSSREASKQAIREGLKNGKSILIFPEGTTSDGPTTIDFKMGSFNVAAEVGRPVVPMVVDYELREDYWVNTPMIVHFVKVLSRKKIKGKIWIGAPITSIEGRILMKECKAQIDAQIPKMYDRNLSKL